MRITTLSAALCLMAIPTLTLADEGRQGMRQVCSQFPCIRDANGKIVGIASSQAHAMRQIQGKWYDVASVLQSGIFVSSEFFYYKGANCVGQPYLALAPSLPPPAHYDGSAFFVPVGPEEDLTAASFSSKTIVSRGGTCNNFTNCNVVHDASPCGPFSAAPAAKIEDVTFAPPFSVR